ncbi:glycogen synthase GlgA [Collinsella sp. zg1085]|nr:glycogen synthase GlgA [Collinsella sp. zg1085]
MGVVFASAEAAPFIKTGGLGDVAGSLPQALVAAGIQVVVMVPKYASIADSYKERMEHIAHFEVPLGWRTLYCGLERLDLDGVTFLFLDNEHYFGRGYPYGFFDDGERFAFFAKAICESLQHLPQDLRCDILHCNDWHTALAPVFLREFYQELEGYTNIKTIFSVHNIAFQGQFSDVVLSDVLGLAHIPAAAAQLRSDDVSINYMLGALNYSDAITTVSPSYAAEIQSPAFGEGLDGVLRRRSSILQGIVNGINTTHFDPSTCPGLAANFSARDMNGKAACKAALQTELGLEVRDDVPLMSMVTRLTRQKGMDLVNYALDRILSGGIQVAVLGTGDPWYEESLRSFEARYPGQMVARIQFDPTLSERMYAGSDLFLMPSLFEPCGLSQMIAMRFGTLPIVRETGGLKDTVIPYNYVTDEGTGFSFANFNGEEMGDAVFRAARLFWDNRAAFERMVKRAMQTDFSWQQSAERYLDLYFWLRPDRERPGGTAAGVAAAPVKASTKKTRARKTSTTSIKSEAESKTNSKTSSTKKTTKRTATPKTSAQKEPVVETAPTAADTKKKPARSTVKGKADTKISTSKKSTATRSKKA